MENSNVNYKTPIKKYLHLDPDTVQGMCFNLSPKLAYNIVAEPPYRQLM